MDAWRRLPLLISFEMCEVIIGLAKDLVLIPLQKVLREAINFQLSPPLNDVLGDEVIAK